MLRHLIFLATFACGAASHAQVTSPAAQQVQLLAPQLVAFAGSAANFESLANGLTQGLPVTLTTVGQDGSLQIVTLQPGAALPTADAARVLETARQNLIVRGVATPTAQQLATALVGGSLSTVAGTTPLAGVLAGAPSTIQVRTEAANALAAAGSTTSGSTVSTTTADVVQSLPAALTQGLSAAELSQAVALASVALAQQGILNPTTEQLRAALLGGTVQSSTGTNVTLQGVLEGRVRGAAPSAPVTGNLSNSPFFGTSDSPVFKTNISPAPATVPAAAPRNPVPANPNPALRNLPPRQ